MINWIVGGLLAIAVVFVIRYLIRQQRRGECAGGCGGCSGCAHGTQSEPDRCGIDAVDYDSKEKRL